jgi:catechol 2,3-dioxygenase-like lactoylglutathione lyase family enzyme
MKVERVLETALYAEDLEAAEAFYTRVLGLEVHSRVAGRHVFFRCGSGMFLVFNPKITEKEKSTPHGCYGRGHVAWQILPKEVEPWRQWLKTSGVAIREDISWPEGGRSIYFDDPAGNCLELASTGVWGGIFLDKIQIND